MLFDIVYVSSMHVYYVEVSYICLTYWDSRVTLPTNSPRCTNTTLALSLFSEGHIQVATNRPYLED